MATTATHTAPVDGSRGLGELFSELTAGFTTLVRQEAQLAKLELSQKVGAVGRDAAVVAAGGSLLYAGFLALLAGVIAGLATAFELPVWGSALIVAAFCLVLGGVLTGIGASAMKRENLKPELTITTLKEDAQWAKRQVA